MNWKWSIAIVCTMLFCQSGLAGQWRIEVDRCRDVDIQINGDSIQVRTTGKDPFLVGSLLGVRSSDSVFEMEYFGVSGLNKLEVYLGPPFSPATRSLLGEVPPSETFSTFAADLDPAVAKLLSKRPTKMRIDLGTQPDIRIEIRNAKLRPPTTEDREQRASLLRLQKEQSNRSARIKQYQIQEFPAKIDKYIVGKDQILLSGQRPEAFTASQLQVVEYPPWVGIADEPNWLVVDASIETKGTAWRCILPRMIGTRDRLHSGFRLAKSNGLSANVTEKDFITARRFPDQILLAEGIETREPLKPSNQKGMGGVASSMPLGELKQLGVTAITLNLVLNRFISDQPGPNRVPIPGTDGTDGDGPAYFNPLGFQTYDPILKWASANQVVVTGILLIATPTKKGTFAPLLHPENDGGKYSMPNVTTSAGCQTYAFVLDKIARRYRDPRSSIGGIENWIAHNEVDYHSTWTNMGSQLPHLVTETYYRSMRMVHNAAKQYNPHARVFVSLTHNWAVENPKEGKQLSPREMLVNLQRYSINEGDFDWGVAYHPYPQSLFANVPWNDTKVTTKLDTPLITIQNIEVLGEFLQHSLMLNSKREPRPVLLSEQGFHTDGYGDEAQAKQAGSLVYAMKKIRNMPMVESFHYHRWVDHPKEGGLKMGLRTLPTDKDRFGTKKLAWSVYQAIGTDNEPQATAGLPKAPDKN